MTESEIQSIIDGNVSEAVDQSEDYTDPDFTSADAYGQNAFDTVMENGGTMEEASDASIVVYEIVTKKLTQGN